ncbi:735_t:CDS:2, partial [Funneliformis mosseae]
NPTSNHWNFSPLQSSKISVTKPRSALRQFLTKPTSLPTLLRLHLYLKAWPPSAI